jgi:hypothetical protein
VVAAAPEIAPGDRVSGPGEREARELLTKTISAGP